MTDLGPLPKCKVDKAGRHHLVFFCPTTKKGDITAVCEQCGATRRMPASGGLGVPLDDLDAASILEATRRPK